MLGFGKKPVQETLTSKEFQIVANDIVALNKNLLVLTARIEKLEEQLQRLRGKFYQEQQQDGEAKDSNSVLLPDR